MQKNRPEHISAYLRLRADAKRERRAKKPDASRYAKANWPRKTP
jgi:hypothetical protein